MKLYTVLLILMIQSLASCLSAMQRAISVDTLNLTSLEAKLLELEFIDSCKQGDLNGDSGLVILQAFLAGDPDIWVMSEDGTILLWLSYHGLLEHIKVLYAFCEKKGFDFRGLVNQLPDSEYTPLHAAAQEGHFEVVTFLLSQEALINAEACDGSTPLHLAVQGGHKPVVACLLRCEGIMMREDSLGRQPLHLSAWKGFKDICILLVKAGARINALADCRITPILAAAYAGHGNVVKVLLRLKADPSIQNSSGETPADYMRNTGCRELVDELEEAIIHKKTEGPIRTRGRRNSP